MSRFDLVVKNGNVVIPKLGVIRADIGIVQEKIAAISREIDEKEAIKMIDASEKYVFPGAVDSHFHIGIFRPMDEDAISESASAAWGGVTTIGSYFRTGKNYLNKSGPYKEIFPEVLENSRESFYTDYVYHISIMTPEQVNEIEMLVKKFGVSTFKYFMFYKMLDLTGAPGSGQYLMINTSYDLGFLYGYMREVARVNKIFKNYGRISLSIHCENPEIIHPATEYMKSHMSGNPLKDYSDARPTFAEKLAIKEAETIAAQTNCPVNILHLSSIDAIESGDEAAQRNPELSILLEATLHHLGLSNDIPYGRLGKVNPPIREKEHVEALWKAVINDDIKTVVSDHACSTKKIKEGDIWTSLAGFGGTELIFPLLLTEGYQKRGLPLHRIAEITSYNSAIYHALYPKKGTIALGSDADLAIIDLNKEKKVSVETLHSAQDFTPFEGIQYKGWPICTILRGKVIFEKDQIVGRPGDGQFIKRPVMYHYREELTL
ncbi:MAG: amidohydrolase family protein [Thermodesulfobacteriota bacterium]|nr:amidohydrolase family protein [Thermodesulfobacteriota bacterium]